MDTFLLFLRATGMGIAVAAPVGPMALLCMERTLSRGITAGMATGGGIALADATVGSIIGFGAGSIASILISHRHLLTILGGLVIVALGVAAVAKSRRVASSHPAESRSHHGELLSAFALTVTNPGTILAFIALFAGLGLASSDNPLTDAAVMIGGIFCGSLIWWAGLTATVGAVRHRLPVGALIWINRGAGIILIVFGVLAAAGGLL
jgi:threonine/homoserine/homoserine lactone efflux protein